ncbi:hypothetical protein FA13DRAFT_1742429 [Coprinellus micaceus]|uniref:MYND-type domain-containing protein n=1 Tax=Coprinellus micaceus TaxID=71717 RepID=A0A4Y7SGX3_COPMI|nr:hypothetical protein FA13DRAFT_1744122 [Coprinellus micaceus]TEB21075.1 hypothetical protein FA13DRAFT_1742429 [Coprinellus micaceus]
MCFPHLMNVPESNLITALEIMLPYFYLSKVRGAISKRVELPLWTASLRDLACRKRNIANLVHEYEACTELNRRLFPKQSRTVSLCSNLWHALTRPSHAAAAERQCCRCHCTTYCSVECQAQDWNEFHSRECGPFERLPYQERNPTGATTTLRTKLDQLKFIDAYANAFFASPRVIRAEKMTRVSSSNPDGRMSYSPCPLDGIATRPESSIARIDYYARQKGRVLPSGIIGVLPLGNVGNRVTEAALSALEKMDSLHGRKFRHHRTR